MRLSTLQIFQQGLSSMQSKQNALHETELQLSSGLKIMKPSDDPTGAVKIINLESNIKTLDQYDRNIAVAETTLAFEENVIANVSNAIQRVRELAIQGNNATNSPSDRASIANEIYARLDELVALANTRDASGEYIFAGNRSDFPAFENNNGTIQYSGDQGQRMIQVGQGTQVAIRDRGDILFQSIPAGDGRLQVEAAAANNGTLLVEDFSISGAITQDIYTITFSQPTLSDPITYSVADNATPPNIVNTGTYVEGSTIGAGNTQVSFSGLPANGDSVVIQPAQNRSLFESVKGIADALDSGATGATQTARFHNDMNSNMLSLDQALDKISDARASVGTRLNNIQSITSINEDFKLQLETALSDTQDLDYAEAISRFNLQLTSLQAAQQAFVKTSNLSLFQYL